MSVLRIRKGHAPVNTLEVGGLELGETFKFTKKFHQDNDVDDLFVIVKASHAYRPVDNKFSSKIAILNLTRHTLSLVSPDRVVYRVDAHIELT